MNSLGRFRFIRVGALAVLTVGVSIAPFQLATAAVQSTTVIETPDPYFKGALKPIKVAPASPQQVTRSYNFQPAAPSGMSPLAPIASSPTRVASNAWPAPNATPAFSASAKPIKGPILMPPITAEVWNAPNTPVSSQAPVARPANPAASSQSAFQTFNGFSAAPVPIQNSTPTTVAPTPTATIQSATPTFGPTTAPQSIIREQPANQIAPNQFAPNGFQPIQTPTPNKTIQSTPRNGNDFNPDFSFNKTKPSTSQTDDSGPEIQKASMIASTVDPVPQLVSPSEQLVKQVGFVQPVMTPVKKQEKVVPFEAGKVVAIVGGEPIFVGDMLFEINQLIERYIAKAPADVKARERQKMIPQILPKFIEAKLLYHGMLGQLPEGVDIDAVLEQAASEFDKKAMPSMMEAAGVDSMTQFDAYLRSLGSSLRNIRESWARDQMTKYFLSQKLTVDTEVTHEELLENYRENKISYAKVAKARWEQVMIRFDRSDSREAAKSEVSKLSQQIVHGANLAALAKKSSHGFMASEGGQQDWTSKGSLVLKEIDEAIFSLPPGSLSNVLETRDGFHVIRVIERTDAGHTPFLEAQVAIKKKIIETKRKAAYNEHLAELRAQIPVEYLINSEAIAKLNGQNQKR